LNSSGGSQLSVPPLRPLADISATFLLPLPPTYFFLPLGQRYETAVHSLSLCVSHSSCDYQYSFLRVRGTWLCSAFLPSDSSKCHQKEACHLGGKNNKKITT
jgi:hypothetical protein